NEGRPVPSVLARQRLVDQTESSGRAGRMGRKGTSVPVVRGEWGRRGRGRPAADPLCHQKRTRFLYQTPCPDRTGLRRSQMIVVMKQGASERQVAQVIEHIEALGLKSHVIVGTELTVVAALGEKRDGARQALETVEGVEKVVPILAPYKMASTEVKREPTIVRVRDLTVGGGHVGVIAGPCSVESREQVLEVAQRVKQGGATGLRGGAFKPRTSPYAFQGLKEKGLELLALAREQTGLAVVTEVMASEQIGMVARYTDVLQIGARNMQN